MNQLIYIKQLSEQKQMNSFILKTLNEALETGIIMIGKKPGHISMSHYSQTSIKTITSNTKVMLKNA